MIEILYGPFAALTFSRRDPGQRRGLAFRGPAGDAGAPPLGAVRGRDLVGEGLLRGSSSGGSPCFLTRPTVEDNVAAPERAEGEPDLYFQDRVALREALSGWRTSGTVVADTPAGGWDPARPMAYGVVLGWTAPDRAFNLFEARSAACAVRPSTIGIYRVQSGLATPLARAECFGAGPTSIPWPNDPSHQYQLVVTGRVVGDPPGRCPFEGCLTVFDLSGEYDALSSAVAGGDATTPSSLLGGHGSRLALAPAVAGLVAQPGTEAAFQRIRLAQSPVYFPAAGSERLAGDPATLPAGSRGNPLPIP